MSKSKEYQKGFEDGHTSVWTGDDERDFSLSNSPDYRQGYMDGENYGEKEDRERRQAKERARK
jgi:hypothetical protein